jgi:hypothetical protein
MKFFNLLWLSLMITIDAEFLTDINPGIYEETIGKLAILNRDAEIWVSMDLGELEKEVNLVSTLSENLMSACRNSTQRYETMAYVCENTAKISATLAKNLQSDLNNLVHKRSKRNINWIELGIKVIFGTIEHLDKKELKNKIDLLTKEVNTQKEKNFELTKFVRNSLSSLNDTLEIISHHEQIMKSMNDQINELVEIANVNNNKLHLSQVLSSLSNLFNLVYQATDSKLREIHQSITDLKNNVMNTKIFSVENIVAALKELKIEDEDLSMTIDIENPNFELLKKITKYVVFIRDNKLIVVYSIPLREDNFGTIFKFYSIPTIENGKAKFLNVTDEYVLVDKNVNKYVTWSRPIFKEYCVKVETTFYCKHLNLMSTEKETCTHQVLLGFKTDLESLCGIKIIEVTKTLLISTEDEKKYLAVTAKEDFGSLILESGKSTLNFFGTQILHVKEKAILRLGHLEIVFFGENLKAEVSFSLKGFINFTVTTKFNFDSNVFPKIIGNKVLNPREVKNLALDLDQINKIMEIESEKDQSTKNVIAMFMLGIIISLIILAIGVTVASKLFQKRLNKTFAEITQSHLDRTKSTRSTKSS